MTPDFHTAVSSEDTLPAPPSSPTSDANAAPSGSATVYDVVTSPVSAPGAGDRGRLIRASDTLAALPGQIAGFVSDERQWLWVLIPYFLAWGVPRIGERFAGWGPLHQSQWGWWINPYSILHFQLWILPGFLGLIWMDRVRLRKRWAGLSYHFTDKNRRLRSGMKLLALGAFLLSLSNLISLPALSVTAMVCITAGIVRRVYGPALFRTMATPLLFLLLIIPPPETVCAAAQMFSMKASNSFAAVVLNLLGKKAFALPNGVFSGGLNVDGRTIITGDSCHGAGIASLTFIVTLWYLLATRAKPFWAAITLILSLCFALLLHGLRVVAMGLTPENSTGLTGALQNLFPYLVVVPAVALTYLANRYAIPVFARSGQRLAKLGVVTKVTGRFTDRLAGSAAAKIGAVGQVTGRTNKATDRALGAAGRGIGGVWEAVFGPLQKLGKKRRSASSQSRWTKKRGRRRDW